MSFLEDRVGILGEGIIKKGVCKGCPKRGEGVWRRTLGLGTWAIQTLGKKRDGILSKSVYGRLERSWDAWQGFRN